MKTASLAVLSAVISALGLWFQDWRQERSLDSRRKRVLNEANDYVAFLKEWLAVQGTASPEEAGLARAQVSEELREMYQRVAKVKPADAAGEGRHFNLRRALLLHRRPTSTRARMLQALFYISVIWLAILIGSLPDALSKAGTDIYFVFLGYLGLGLVPMLLLRALALRTEQRRA